jgi:hypothetical protein
MEIRMSIWMFVIWFVALVLVLAENEYLSSINTAQQHTIRQYMGLELGPDATPVLPKHENDPANSDPRRIQRSL